jgi:Tfp pilus assembly protein FimT
VIGNEELYAQSRGGRRRENGFTLIQMVMVLLITMILMGFAVFAIQGALGNYRLHNAVASATWAIQSARYQALMEGYPYQVSFSATTNSYQLLSASTPGSPSTFANVGNSVPLSETAMTINQSTTYQFTPMGYVTANPATALTTTPMTITAWGNTATIVVSNYGNITVTYGHGIYQ